MAEWAAIFGGTGAAAVTGLFAVFAVKFQRDNTEQHRQSMIRREQGHHENMELRMEAKQRLDVIAERIDEVRDDVKEVRSRQDDHLEWHAEQ